MLKRRDFLKTTAALSIGALLPLSLADHLSAEPRPEPAAPRPFLPHHGHVKSGCAFRPEMAQIWAGGGGALPEGL